MTIIDRPAAAAAPPVYLHGVPLRAVKHFVGGTHRTVPPEATLERVRPHFPACDITRLADITGLDHIGIHVALAYRPNGLSLSNSAGKGFTRAAALVSAAMEGIELHHAEHVRLPVVRATHADLGADVVAADRLTYSRGTLFNPRHPEYWVEAWDLVEGRGVHLPFSLVSMTGHEGERPRCRMEFQISSNGLASGNHPLEAICAALYEAVERDAVACHVWSRNTFGRRIPRVDLDTVRHPLVLELLERLAAAQVGVILYDLGVDTDVPVYMASIYDTVDRHLGVYGGYGAHLDPQVAMLRALTEAVQARLIYIAGSRDDHFRHDYLRSRDADTGAAIRSLQALPFGADGSARRDESTSTFEGDVQVLLEKLARAGLPQVLVTDLTREELGIPVVRVYVPGLEGYPGLPHYKPGPRARAFARAHAESAR